MSDNTPMSKPFYSTSLDNLTGYKVGNHEFAADRYASALSEHRATIREASYSGDLKRVEPIRCLYGEQRLTLAEIIEKGYRIYI